ncbi:hypothetical protein RS9916_27019 [Synechococcus sp. RS9916]|nr:hypothetical protein RS9916_27019 [Synechococcus sp. RS9916]
MKSCKSSGLRGWHGDRLPRLVAMANL